MDDFIICNKFAAQIVSRLISRDGVRQLQNVKLFWSSKDLSVCFGDGPGYSFSTCC